MALVIDKDTDIEFHKSVRRMLGLPADDTLTIPDEDIVDDSIFAMSEIMILEAVPDAATLVADDATKLKLRIAQVNLMASLLCPSMPNRVEVEVKNIDSGWKKKPVDYGDLTQTLTSKAFALMEPFITGVGDARVFSIAPSKRAVEEDASHKA